MDINSNTLCWIAGLLESKGYFGAGIPSEPKYPRVTIRMTNENVISRLASMLGHSYTLAPHKYAYGKTDYYKVSVKGSPAVSLMRQLRPVMGKRRQSQIDRALENYVDRPNTYINSAKLSEKEVRVIKIRLANGDMPTRIARDFSISYDTIKHIRRGEIWKHVKIADESDPESEASARQQAMIQLDTNEKRLNWLLGLLEGKGSFAPRISLTMNNDEDIIRRFAEICGVQYQSLRSQTGNHKNVYDVSIKGEKAIELLRELYPFMGQYLQEEINKVLDSYADDLPKN